MTTADRLRVAGTELEKLDLHDGEILVLRIGTPQEEWPEDVIGQFLVDNNLANVLVIYLPPGGDLEVLTEEQMAAAGWIRKP